MNDNSFLQQQAHSLNPFALVTNDRGSIFSRSMVDFYAMYPSHTDQDLNALSNTVRPSLREDIESLKSENDALRDQIRLQCDEFEHLYKETITKRAEMLDHMGMLERKQLEIKQENVVLSQLILSSESDQNCTINKKSESDIVESASFLIQNQGCDFRPTLNSAFQAYKKLPSIPEPRQMIKLCTRKYNQLNEFMGEKIYSSSTDESEDEL